MLTRNVALVCWILSLGAGRAFADDVDRSLLTILVGASDGWAKIERAMEDFEIEWVEEHVKSNEKASLKLKCRFFWDESRKSQMKETVYLDRPVRNLRSANPEYHFLVAWVGEDVSRPELMSVNVNREDRPGWQEDSWLASLRVTLNSPIYIAGVPLRLIIKESEGFSIKKLSFGAESSIAKLEATYSGPKMMFREPGARYYAELDSEKGWTAVKTIWATQKGSRERIIDSLDYEGFGWILKTLKEIDTHPTTPIVSTTTYEFTEPQVCTLADAEFRLPQYGISEAVLGTLKPNPWPRWLLVGLGILALVVGGLLLRTSRFGVRA